MKLKDLLEVVYNYHEIHIFVWDTHEELYVGPCLEFDKKLCSLNNRIVLSLLAENYMTDSLRLSIGVK